MENPAPFDHPGEPSLEEVRGVLLSKPDAFHAFFERWYPRIHRFALHRTGCPTRARRVTSATMRQIVTELRDFDDPVSLAGWILRITRESAEWASRPDTVSARARTPRPLLDSSTG